MTDYQDASRGQKKREQPWRSSGRQDARETVPVANCLRRAFARQGEMLKNYENRLREWMGSPNDKFGGAVCDVGPWLLLPHVDRRTAAGPLLAGRSPAESRGVVSARDRLERTASASGSSVGGRLGERESRDGNERALPTPWPFLPAIPWQSATASFCRECLPVVASWPRPSPYRDEQP